MTRSAKHRVKKIAANTASFLLIVLIVFITALASIVGTLHYRVTDSEKYISAILNDDFYETVNAHIKDCFEVNSSIIDIDSDKAYESLNKDDLKGYVDNYVTNFVADLFSADEKDYYKQYDSPELYNFIESTFLQYEDEIIAAGETVESLSKKAYADMISDLNVELNFIPEEIWDLVKDSLNSKIGSFTSGKYEVHDLYYIIGELGSVFVSLIIFDFLLCGVYMILNHRKYHKAAIKIGFATFFSTFLVFVPGVVLKQYDIAERISIDESPLRYMFMNLFHTAENGIIAGTLFALMIGLVVLIGGIAIYFIRIYRRNSRIDYDEALRRDEERLENTPPDQIQILR